MNTEFQLLHTIQPGDSLYHISKFYHTTVPMLISLNPNIDPNNLTIGSSIIIRTNNNINSDNNNVIPPRPQTNYDTNRTKLMKEMRLAWSQHVYWTRMLLISIAEGLADEADVTNRLLENPKDIANIFGQYYSQDVATLIEQLLTEHLQLGAELIKASKEGDSAMIEELNGLWYANADKMADAFSSINPYYNREEVRKMLYNHLDLIKQEVAMRLAKNYPEDIKAFDNVEKEAMDMADYFVQGIMRQFPHKFVFM